MGAIKIKGSTSGSTTITAPATGSDETIELSTALAAKADKSAGYQYHSTVYFTSSGTFTKATYPWLRAIRVKCQGSGGGGGGAGATSGTQFAAGSGGGGGGYAESFITDIAGLSASVTVTVGAGGAGGVGNANGSNGASSSFGTAVVAGGGNFGSTVISTAFNSVSGGTGGTGTTGDLLIAGGGGGNCMLYPTSWAHCGYGGGSVLGSQTQGVIYVASGIAGLLAGESGSLYGGGGGGAANRASGTAQNGGTGAAGIVIVELYA